MPELTILPRNPSFRASRVVARALLAGVMVSGALALSSAASAPAQAAETVQRKISGSESYVPVQGIRATVTNRLRAVGIINVEAGLDIPDEKVRAGVNARMPRIKDLMRAELSSYAGTFYRFGEVPDTDMIRQRLQRVMDGHLGEGAAVVLLNAVIVYRSN